MNPWAVHIGERPVNVRDLLTPANAVPVGSSVKLREWRHDRYQKDAELRVRQILRPALRPLWRISRAKSLREPAARVCGMIAPETSAAWPSMQSGAGNDARIYGSEFSDGVHETLLMIRKTRRAKVLLGRF
jgi:hypothetical protein